MMNNSLDRRLRRLEGESDDHSMTIDFLTFYEAQDGSIASRVKARIVLAANGKASPMVELSREEFPIG